MRDKVIDFGTGYIFIGPTVNAELQFDNKNRIHIVVITEPSIVVRNYNVPSEET
jgi:hypothetical protein